MRSAQDILEFRRILGMLAGKCRTRRGALLAEGLSPYEDLHELRKELLRMRELSSLLPEKGSLPLRAGEDLRAFLGDLKKGREPSGRMLLYVLQDIEDGKAARAYLGEGDSPLKELSPQLPGNERLREELTRALEEDGSLKDQASGRLLSIRRSMKALEKGLRREAGTSPLGTATTSFPSCPPTRTRSGGSSRASAGPGARSISSPSPSS